MNSFSAISIHNCWARRGAAARAAAAEKLVYHLNKKQSLGDQSAISTNSVAEFSLAGKAARVLLQPSSWLYLEELIDG